MKREYEIDVFLILSAGGFLNVKCLKKAMLFFVKV